MDPFRYFGLRASPFEGRPDPAFYYAAGGHDEALAAVRYAVHAGKSCAAVLGESGLGKSLVARMLAERVNRKTNVLWLNGVGQPKAHTELSVYEAGTLQGLGRFNGRPIESLLNAWTRSTQAWSNPTLLIVDNAESLRESAWQELLSLMTREFEAGRRVTVALFGLSLLRGQLASPRLERIRRRIFRLVELRPFSAEETSGYITHRIRVAGREQPLFTPAAITNIFDATAGIPALINQLCDNAMVDAFGEERSAIDAPDIQAAIRAVIGTRTKAPRFATTDNKRAPAPRAAVPKVVQRVVRKAESTLESVDHSVLRPLIERVVTPRETPDPAVHLELLATSLPPLNEITAAVQSARALEANPATEEPVAGEMIIMQPLAALESPSEPVEEAVAAAEAAEPVLEPTTAIAPPAVITPSFTPRLSSIDTQLRSLNAQLAAAMSRVRNERERKARPAEVAVQAAG